MMTKYLRLVLSVFSIVLVASCASTEYSTTQQAIIDESSLYQLYIDEHGRLLSPASENPVVDEAAYVEAILANFEDKQKANPEMQLSIFIHGGLNTFKSATSRVDRSRNEMMKEGKYPLFISWNSGPFTNYGDHLFRLRQGEKTTVTGPLSSPFVFIEDILRSIARLPASTYQVLFGQNSVRINKYTKEEKAADLALKNLSATGIQVHNDPDDTGHTFTDFATIWNPTKLVTAPFVDGLGTGAWNSMLRRTDLVLQPDAAFQGKNGAAGSTAVSDFMDRFSSTYPDEKVDIVGHSMGAIIANNIVSRYPAMNFENIVYMAAACRIKDIQNVVSPYLQRNAEARFYNLSLNPYRDISENIFYDFIPRGSLLVWIDQTLGSINSFQDRTAGFWFNMVRGADKTFIDDPKLRSRVHLTQFGIRDGSPQNHGSFSHYKFWSEKFWRGEVEAKYESGI